MASAGNNGHAEPSISGGRNQRVDCRKAFISQVVDAVSQVEPKVVARLVLEKEKKGELEEEVLELEVDVLKEVVATLEEAAAEANSPAAKKLTRR